MRQGMRWVVLGIVGLGLVTEGAAAEKPDLASLSWMAGSWGGEDGGARMEEHWTAPRGGLMLGLHRDVKGEKKAFFEFLRIEAQADGIVYLAMPLGKPATAFKLVESAPSRVVFANPEHDFPQRILYWLTPDGALHARVEGTQGGKTSAEEWEWHSLPSVKAAP